MQRDMRIAVIGAGICGTSSAYLIKQKYPTSDVTIFADKFDGETTSFGAAGISAYDNQNPRVIRWKTTTVDYALDVLANDPDAAKIGISLVHGYCVSRKQECPKYLREHPLLEFKELTPADMKHLPKFVKSGYSCTTVVIETSKYIPFITKEFQRNGGRIVKQRVKNFNELYQFDIIVNCSGLGAKELCHDHEMLPMRGQLVRVHAPWVKHFIICMEAESDGRWGYIIPNQDTVVLGTTLYKNNDNYELSQADRKWILQNATTFIPSLKNAKIVREWVGLRPFRKEIRVEQEQVVLQSKTDVTQTKSVHLIHNYGHGGFGVGLFMGCSQEVLKMVENCLVARPKL